MPQANDTLVRVNVPHIATKKLRFRKNGDRRILTISSNFLSMFGFEKGDAVIETSLGNSQGIEISRVQDTLDVVGRIKRVYARRYPRRRNNPLEHQVEVSSQKLLDEAFPADCTHVHVQFQQNRLRVTPIYSTKQRALSNAERADPDSVFAALTSGVDLSSMRSEGFSVSAVLEWRPPEARDKSDLSETGMVAALANSGPLIAAFNEDVTSCAIDRIALALEKTPPMVFHASPQCDDHSPLKSKADKAQALEDTSSTSDMMIDLLNIIEKVSPPVVVLENVPGFVSSPAYEIASLRLRRWGYKRFEHVGDARDHGGLTSRRRAYVVFTALDAPFAFEDPSSPRAKDIWSIVEPYLADCRDVSHSKSIQDGKQCGRLRRITEASTSAPTPIKSQGRMAKDSLVIERSDGALLFPTEDLLKRLLGLQDVDLSAVSATIATEIIGQSIDRPHHEMVLRSVRKHIEAWKASFAKAFSCSEASVPA